MLTHRRSGITGLVPSELLFSLSVLFPCDGLASQMAKRNDERAREKLLCFCTKSVSKTFECKCTDAALPILLGEIKLLTLKYEV